MNDLSHEIGELRTRALLRIGAIVGILGDEHTIRWLIRMGFSDKEIMKELRRLSGPLGWFWSIWRRRA